VTISDAFSAADLVDDAVSVPEPYGDGFDAFVLAHGSTLARSAYLLTGDRQRAEDLVQTALAKVSMRWDQVAAKGDPTAYVRTTIVRTAIGWHRRRWSAEVPAPDGNVPETVTGDGTAAVDARDRLRRALLQLPARQRAAVVLRFYEDRPESDVAALMGCSVGTVKSQTAKGLARLRAALDLEEEQQ
jgi:RNA polymerase sigma-70 factor (sigma-E family)